MEGGGCRVGQEGDPERGQEGSFPDHHPGRVELEKAVKEFRGMDRKDRAGFASSVSRMRESIRAVRDEVQPEDDLDTGVL